MIGIQTRLRQGSNRRPDNSSSALAGADNASNASVISAPLLAVKASDGLLDIDAEMTVVSTANH